MFDIRNLSKVYAMGDVHVKALDNVSFTIDTGEMACIMSKSGSGKSTLLGQLGLLAQPSSGEIYIDGRYQGLAILCTGFAHRKKAGNNTTLQ